LHYNEIEFVFPAGSAKGDDALAPDISGRLSEVSEFRPWFKHYDPEVPLHLTYPRIPLYRLLDETATKHPDSPCTNFFGRRLTYQQIKELSGRFAVGIRTLGLRKSDRVVLLLRRALREEELRKPKATER
jgi:non-ribosomal peptide synthetase component F